MFAGEEYNGLGYIVIKLIACILHVGASSISLQKGGLKNPLHELKAVIRGNRDH
jgi:hypothetical protein